MKEYREKLAVAIFLTGLQSDLANQIIDQILGADSVPKLQSTFSRVLHVSTGSPASSVVSDRTAMAASTRGRGTRGTHRRGRGRDDRKCDHCGRSNYTSDRCWDKFERPPLAHLASCESSAFDSLSLGLSSHYLLRL